MIPCVLTQLLSTPDGYWPCVGDRKCLMSPIQSQDFSLKLLKTQLKHFQWFGRYSPIPWTLSVILGLPSLMNVDYALHLLICATWESFPFQQSMWPAFLGCPFLRQKRYENVPISIRQQNIWYQKIWLRRQDMYSTKNLQLVLLVRCVLTTFIRRCFFPNGLPVSGQWCGELS